MKPNELFDLTQEVPYKNIGDDVDYCIFEHNGVIYLSFQSSRTKRDWQNNFNFPCKLYKNQDSCMRIARGWGDAYKSCNDIIMEELIEIVSEYDGIVHIIGHSLGGALAILAAEDYHYRTKKWPEVITFGTPKVLFGKKTKKYFAECVLYSVQYTHVYDIVPKLPPFPGYTTINTHYVGKKTWKFWELFNPKYHVSYGDESLYYPVIKPVTKLR